MVVYSKEWQCCGTSGIQIYEVFGDSQWCLIGVCLSCAMDIVISKHGVRKHKNSIRANANNGR